MAERRMLMRYRLRRIGTRSGAGPEHIAPILHFIYDFDYQVLAVDKPRRRFARIASVLRHPSVVGPIPRSGRLLPWSALSRAFIRRLDLEPEFTKTLVLERLGKEGWKIEYTFHIERHAVAWVSDRWVTPEPVIFRCFATALTAALDVENTRLRPFLYGLGNAILAGYATLAVTTLAAFAFPIAVTVLGDWMRWASRTHVRGLSQAMVVLLLIAIAYGFFRLKLTRQRFYGAFEVGVGLGMVAAALPVAESTSRLQLVLQIMAAVYVMIRGFVNIREARDRARVSFRQKAKDLHQKVTGDQW